MDIGPAELIIVLLVVLLLFGGSKLPKLARSLGEAQRELKKGMSGDDPATTVAVAPPPVAPLPVPPPEAAHGSSALSPAEDVPPTAPVEGSPFGQGPPA
jgi:sec-independent protein translocase protein TatA